MNNPNNKLNLELNRAYLYSAQGSSEMLRDNFDPKQVNFLLSSISGSASSLEPSGSDSDNDLIETFEIPLLPKKRRSRTNFDTWQVDELENVFKTTQYPDLFVREAMALKLGLVESRIQVWFQNRRARTRREGKTKSAPGRRKKSETEKSNRAILFAHLNTVKKTNNPKKPSSDLLKTSTQKEPSRNKTFTIESILSCKYPSKESLSVNLASKEDEHFKGTKETGPSRSINHFSIESILSRKDPVPKTRLSDNLSKSIFAQPSEPQSHKEAAATTNSPGSRIQKTKHSLDCNFTNPSAPYFRRVAFAQRLKPGLLCPNDEQGDSELAMERDQVPFNRTNVEGLGAYQSCQNNGDLTSLSGTSETRPARSVQSPHNHDKFTKMTGRYNHKTSPTKVVIENYESNFCNNEGKHPFARTVGSCRPQIQVNEVRAPIIKSPHNDFESFRTTSILTLRNRAENHIRHLNVCS